MSSDFDLHDHRRQLKQLRDSGTTQLFEAREDMPCPACGRPVSRVFVTEQRTTSFPEPGTRRFCLLRQDDAIVLFRH